MASCEIAATVGRIMIDENDHRRQQSWSAERGGEERDGAEVLVEPVGAPGARRG